MNIYFTASTVGKKDFGKNYDLIVSLLKKNGHTVKYKHLINAENMRSTQSKDERAQYQKTLEQWIASADCVVVEGSYPSISVGFEISLALRLGKPILFLYSNGSTPSLIDNSSNEKLICERYTLQNVKDILEDFLQFAADNIESRFTFFITSHISAYLDKVASEKKIPKAVYLRQLIEKDMQTT